jgi:hypothetical protein
MISLRHGYAGLLLLALLSCAGPALAHPALEEAERLTKQLELEPALAAYQRALDSNALQFDELVTLLSERILVLHGLHRERERDADLTWLMAIAPMRDLDVRAPPDVVAKYRELRARSAGPLSIKLTAQVAASVEAHARLAGSVPEGTRVRIWVRAHDGMWQYEDGAALRHVATPGSQLELYAEALGPGGVAVAHDYSQPEPLRLSVGGAAAEPAVPLQPGAVQADAPSWARRHRGWLIATSVVVALAGGAVATYFLVREKDQNQPENTSVTPMVRF